MGTVVTAVVAAAVASVLTLTLVVLAASYGARAWTRYRERQDSEA